MKHMIYLVFCACLWSAAHGQSIMGTWQLVKESSCMEDQLISTSASEEEMVNELKSQSKPAPQIVTFKEKMTGEESTRILNKKKGANNKSFLYKFDGELLMILDKKSRTISESYHVEKFSADSLIISNTSRPCETKILLKIR